MSEIKIDIFSWSDSFNTGLEEVDLQHKHMVEILNRLAQRIALGAEYSEIKDILTQLTDFTLFHFHSEEQIWEKHLPNDPLSNLHKKHHAEFALKLSQIKSNLKQPVTFETVQEIFGFLSRWTILHVVESDKHLAYIVNYLNQGLSIDEAKIAANQEMHLSNAFVIDAILSIYQGLSLNTLELIRETYISRQMQIKLHESEERLHEAMNYARIGHWDLPYQGTQANWSVQMYELFGLSTDASSGPETLCGLMSQEHQDRFMNSMQNSFEHGHEHHVEYLITRPNDGQKRWIECRGKVIKSNDGTPEKISGFIQDITEHKETEQKIEMLAFYDPLTLLPNRRLLLDRLKQVLSSSARSTSSNALLFLDIDHFKTLNDTHGHDYGDMLLKKIAKRLGKNIREGDTLARIGGDEFVIVLEGLSEHALTAATQTETISNKILQVLAKPYRLKDIHYNSSISIGVVLFKDHQTDTTELMKQADIAMYQAKLAGRNTLKFFDPKMQ
ncbi:diguanylate cyclase domain-containing protein [Shewanella gelidii]|uniref:Diguanylate cyclase n=1 Tax=Shewanella gelidii TaxID=1642821 RepID=A0A917JLR7_9GAMM|nr:diguanylate cyclase [Shewanella gelidii]MCL1096954.1 diguanylate cyclase [Shewanella gelidii]GGI71482.1 hypothetical protein GCM10009332_06000 [Shewanella gelidii]